MQDVNQKLEHIEELLANPRSAAFGLGGASRTKDKFKNPNVKKTELGVFSAENFIRRDYNDWKEGRLAQKDPSVRSAYLGLKNKIKNLPSSFVNSVKASRSNSVYPTVGSNLFLNNQGLLEYNKH